MIELSRLRGSERYAACSDDVMAYLPFGSAQKGCICLPYTAPELSAGLSFSKCRSFNARPLGQGREGNLPHRS